MLRNASTIYPGGSITRQYPFVRWSSVKAAVEWKQGQHVLTVGGTGSGKSTVAGEFLPRRSLVVVCVSKGVDPIFEGPYYRDYETIEKWKPGDKKRLLLRPPNLKTIKATKLNKTLIFGGMLDDVLLKRGKWCIDIDETHYMSETLKLYDAIIDMLEQGRSAGISMWNNTQRPSGIPLATYVNSSHAFLFSAQEEYDVRRLASLGNKHTHSKELRANVERLDSFNSHEMIYLDRSGRIPPVRTIVDVRKR